MSPIAQLVLAAAVLILLSVITSQASGRLGVPALVLFLVLGMLAGSEGIGGIAFDDPWLAQLLASVALAYILFSGGLDTQWSQARSVLWSGLSLSTLGVLLTAAIVMIAARVLFDFGWIEGLLLGGIMASTDAAAVFTVLRAQGVRLRTRLQQLLEFESGTNDPIAVFMTVTLTSLLGGAQQLGFELVTVFVLQMCLGLAIGWGLGHATIWLVNRSSLHSEGLYPVLTSGMVLLIFGLASALGGNEFLAVYVAGLVASEQDFVHKRSLLRFHDGIAWIMQILMFLSLGLLVFPSRLVPVLLPGLVIALVLMFIARPLAVNLLLPAFGFNWRERQLIGWVGLRGAVPIVLATVPMLAGLPQSDMIFNLVFFIVLTSVVVQGPSIPWIARVLGVRSEEPPRPRFPLEFEPQAGMKSELAELIVAEASWAAGRLIVELGLPDDVLIVLLGRDQHFVIPNGGTRLQAGDILLLLADNEARQAVQNLLQKGPG